MPAADLGPARSPGDWLSAAATHLVLYSHGGAAYLLQASTVTGHSAEVTARRRRVSGAIVCTVSGADLGPSRAPDAWLGEAVTHLV